MWASAAAPTLEKAWLFLTAASAAWVSRQRRWRPVGLVVEAAALAANAEQAASEVIVPQAQQLHHQGPDPSLALAAEAASLPRRRDSSSTGEIPQQAEAAAMEALSTEMWTTTKPTIPQHPGATLTPPSSQHGGASHQVGHAFAPQREILDGAAPAALTGCLGGPRGLASPPRGSAEPCKQKTNIKRKRVVVSLSCGFHFKELVYMPKRIKKLLSNRLSH